MLKISEFSRLTQTPAKTLRYYDDIGLFKPASVDRWTGYRYYSVAQLPRLNRIRALKALGLSLEQIRDVLDEGMSAEQMRGMLRLKAAEIRQQLVEDEQRLAYVHMILHQIEQESKMSDYDVVVKSVPAFRVASIRLVVPEQPQISAYVGRAFGELMDYLKRCGTPLTPMQEQAAVTLYHDEEFTGKDMDVETAVGIAGDVAETERVKVRVLPAVEHMASVVHRGSFDKLPLAYGALAQWIEANGYTEAGPARELTLEYDHNGSPDDWVTEIQFPIAKRA